VGATIARLKAERQSILLVEQNIGFALDLADLVYVMSKGRIVFTGTPDDLRAHADIERRYLGVG
jgi:branched-chain amino acid transport system ATP-binding protein